MLSDSTSRSRKLLLGVMAKYWKPGRVKTRLGASIGMRQSAELHYRFCRHLAKMLAVAADERCFVISPAESEHSFVREFPDWGIEFQSSGDLGQRMSAWFSQPRSGDRFVDRVLIGADCPMIESSQIDHCRQLLCEQDVVLGPASDGGYYLIGLRGWREQYAQLFEGVPWSSEHVFDITLDRAKQLDLSLATLQPMDDVDTRDDLLRLKDRLTNDSAIEQHESLRREIEAVLDPTCSDGKGTE